jgi:hypothetical protein
MIKKIIFILFFIATSAFGLGLQTSTDIPVIYVGKYDKTGKFSG